LLLVQDLVAEGVLESQALNFRGSSHLMFHFLNTVGLSFRRARARRRPIFEDEECAHFVANVITAYHPYPPHLIVNFDESNWHLVMIDDQMVAVRGAETVCHYYKSDAKANFPFFATIIADGSKLPWILIAKRNTDRCHEQLGSHDSDICDGWHWRSEWSTAPWMTRYLKWLRVRIPQEPLCLIMDQFMTQAAPEIQEEGEEWGIKMIWVPKGETGRYQPLDRRRFGALKSKGKVEWRR
jgi:hypothetical protein